MYNLLMSHVCGTCSRRSLVVRTLYLPALRLLLRLGHVETLLEFTSLFTFSGYNLSDDVVNTINEF